MKKNITTVTIIAILGTLLIVGIGFFSNSSEEPTALEQSVTASFEIAQGKEDSENHDSVDGHDHKGKHHHDEEGHKEGKEGHDHDENRHKKGEEGHDHDEKHDHDKNKHHKGKETTR